MRRGDVMQGPFPAGMVSRYILLGRIRASDELSQDQETWQLVSETPEVFPEVMQTDLADPVAEQHLLAARRWADERAQVDRRGLATNLQDEGRRSSDRRKAESFEATTRRKTRSADTDPKKNAKRDRLLSGLIALTILIVIVAFMFSLKPRPNVSHIDCSVPAAAGVNWSNCRMDGAVMTDVNLTGASMMNMQLSRANLNGSTLAGADLSFTIMSITSLQNTDLRDANLIGVNLHNSDLTNANLSGADLSYADLTGARLDRAVMTDVKLDNAIWVDGRTCAAGSIGKCN